MAIVVEEEQGRQFRGAGFLVWFLILIIIAVGAYYVFFKRPDLVEVAIPVNFQNTQRILPINLSPEEVVQSPKFQRLKLHVTPLAPDTEGRANPFLAQ